MIRLLLATGIAALVTLVGTKLLITALTRRHIGQPIHEDVPEGHTVKAGTPTMGGIAIVVGGVCGYLASNLYDGVFTWTGLATMGAIAGAGIVGFLDDWIKIANERNLGLNKRSKTLGLLVVAIAFALLILWRTKVHTTISFGRFDDLGWTLGKWVWVAWAVLVIFASSKVGSSLIACGSMSPSRFGARRIARSWSSTADSSSAAGNRGSPDAPACSLFSRCGT